MNLELNNICKNFGEQVVWQNVCFHDDISSVAIIGTSDSQQQRVSLVKAIAVKLKLLLLDEPTSALDPEYTTEVLDMLGELQTERLKTKKLKDFLGKILEWRV